MDIKGKITLFPERKEGKNAEGKEESFIVIKGTISTKKQNGEGYLNKSVSIRLTGTNFPKEKVNQLDPAKCYDMEVEEGFISVKEVKDRRELELVVLKGKLSNPREVKKVEASKPSADLPF